MPQTLLATLVVLCTLLLGTEARAQHGMDLRWSESTFDLRGRAATLTDVEARFPRGIASATAHSVQASITGAHPLRIDQLHLRLDFSAPTTSTTSTTPTPSRPPTHPALAALLFQLREAIVTDLAITIDLGNDRTWTWRANSVHWKLAPRSPQKWNISISLVPLPTHAPLTLAFTAEFNSDGVRLHAHPIPCHDLLPLVPQAWRQSFKTLQLAGHIAPWVELRKTAGSAHAPEFRIGGVTDDQHHCTVAELIWEGRDVDWLNTNYVRPVRHSLPPGVAVHVGPGTPDYVPLAELPAYVGAAMIHSEEHGFHQHHGIDANLIARAMTHNIRTRRLSTGGSTITQQLVKNLFLTHDKAFKRKFQEAILATRVWQLVSKDRILELYLNCIEYAPGVWGIGPAAHHYFAKPAPHLTLTEATFLAAIKPSPLDGDLVRRGHLDLHATGLQATIHTILAAMHRHGHVTAREVDDAKAQPLRWARTPDDE